MSLLRNVSAGMLVLGLVSLVGCASADGDSDEFPVWSLVSVRETQNSQLQELMDLVPVDQVVEVWGPIPKMSAISCDTDLGGNMPLGKKRTGSYVLPGGAEVTVADDFDVLGHFDEVAVRQEALGWGASIDETSFPKLRLYATDGFYYSLMYFPKGEYAENAIAYSSFSSCFLPSTELDRFEKY